VGKPSIGLRAGAGNANTFHAYDSHVPDIGPEAEEVESSRQEVSKACSSRLFVKVPKDLDVQHPPLLHVPKGFDIQYPEKICEPARQHQTQASPLDPKNESAISRPSRNCRSGLVRSPEKNATASAGAHKVVCYPEDVGTVASKLGQGIYLRTINLEESFASVVSNVPMALMSDGKLINTAETKLRVEAGLTLPASPSKPIARSVCARWTGRDQPSNSTGSPFLVKQVPTQCSDPINDAAFESTDELTVMKDERKKNSADPKGNNARGDPLLVHRAELSEPTLALHSELTLRAQHAQDESSKSNRHVREAEGVSKQCVSYKHRKLKMPLSMR
jgi:hypothetical protein